LSKNESIKLNGLRWAFAPVVVAIVAPFPAVGVNLTASESQIRDANMAQEVSAHTKDQILVTVQAQLAATVNLNAKDVLQLFAGLKLP